MAGASTNFVDLGSVRGYIIDVARLIFKRRSDGKVFLMNNGSGGGVSTTNDNVTISNGWISAPRKIIGTNASETITYTSNLTDLWLIAGVNGVNMVSGISNGTSDDGDTYELDGGTNNVFTVAINGNVANVAIEGFSCVSSAANTGEFSVVTANNVTTVTIVSNDSVEGDIVPITYTRMLANSSYVEIPSQSNLPTGELTRVLPLYSENDSSSAIVCYLFDHYPKVKVTSVPSFDQSYKSESSSSIEFQTVTNGAANSIRRKLTVGI